MSFLVLQHASCEPPAAFGEELESRGFATEMVEVDEGGSLPAGPDGFAGVIAMGGPMGVYERDAHPWLNREVALLEAALAAGVPIWGVCLGAQLLAAALGARVFAGPDPEVGVREVRLTEAAASDPVFALAPRSFSALHWHGDTYELPAGAVRLAESDLYPQQAFRHGDSYGIQFHLEVPASLVGEWAAIPAYAASLESALGPGAIPALVDEVAAVAPEATGLARRLMTAWLDLDRNRGGDLAAA